MKRPPISFTPLYPDHLPYLKVHPVQTDEYNALLHSARYDALSSCAGVTAWASERVLALAGVFPLWQDRAEAWCLCSEDMKHYVPFVMDKIRLVLDTVPFARVEMNVKVNNQHGHKLAKYLGFTGSQRVQLPSGKVVQADGLFENYWPYDGGTDVVMYSRVRRS